MGSVFYPTRYIAPAPLGDATPAGSSPGVVASAPRTPVYSPIAEPLPYVISEVERIGQQLGAPFDLKPIPSPEPEPAAAPEPSTRPAPAAPEPSTRPAPAAPRDEAVGFLSRRVCLPLWLLLVVAALLVWRR